MGGYVAPQIRPRSGRTGGYGTGAPPFPFWNNRVQTDRVTPGWPQPEPLQPAQQEWCRFKPTALFCDPWVEACRSRVPSTFEAGWWRRGDTWTPVRGSTPPA